MTLKMPPGFEMPGVLGPVTGVRLGTAKGKEAALDTFCRCVFKAVGVSSFLLNGTPWPDFKIWPPPQETYWEPVRQIQSVLLPRLRSAVPKTGMAFMPLQWTPAPSPLRTQLWVSSLPSLPPSSPQALHWGPRTSL